MDLRIFLSPVHLLFISCVVDFFPYIIIKLFMHTVICAFFFGLAIQVVALYSNSWVLLQLMLVPMCGDETPVEYDTVCGRLHYNPQDVVRAGLWKVCHYFPFGFIPEFYFYTEPYCSNFSEDEEPEEWLEMSQFMCQLSVILNIVGLLISLLADFTRSSDICWSGSSILLISATCGLLGAVTFYTNISKDFLVPHKVDIISIYGHWGIYCFIDGSAMTLLAGILLNRIKSY